VFIRRREKRCKKSAPSGNHLEKRKDYFPSIVYIVRCFSLF